VGNYINIPINPYFCILYKVDPSGIITEFSQSNSGIAGFYLMQSAAQKDGDLWIASRYKGVITFKKANF
jgi:hypothetical protein